MPSQPGIRIGILLLLAWTLVGTAGFAIVEGWAITDTLYMTILTIARVRFGEIHPLSSGGKLFASIIIVTGLGTVIETLTSVGQILLEGELARVLGRRQMKSGLEKLNGHFIISGFGRVGRTVADGLREHGFPVYTVEHDQEIEEELKTQHLPAVVGDAIEEENLLLAGVQRAQAVLALLRSDADNTYFTLIAKGLDPEINVVAMASSEKAEVKLKQGEGDHVFSPYRIAGLRLVHSILHPPLVELVELATHRQHLQLGTGEAPIPDSSELRGQSLSEAQIRTRFKVIIVAIKKGSGQLLFNPDATERIEAGDALVALGSEEDIEELARTAR